MYPEKSRSNWWYLLPIFLGIIGGIIAYFAIRKDDLPKAKKCIYLSLILFAVGIFLDVLFIVTEPDIWYGVNV
tara:strand:+ start:77 stop:295 length:219 start_codon:yes stop_codon:yes gene_type:complete